MFLISIVFMYVLGVYFQWVIQAGRGLVFYRNDKLL